MFAANTTVVALLLIMVLIVGAVLLTRWLTARRPSQVARARATTPPNELPAVQDRPVAEVAVAEVAVVDGAVADVDGAVAEVADVDVDGAVVDVDVDGAAADGTVTDDSVDGAAGDEPSDANDGQSKRFAFVRGGPAVTASVDPPDDDVDLAAARDCADPAAAAEHRAGVGESGSGPLTAGFAEGWHGHDDEKRHDPMATHETSDEQGPDISAEDERDSGSGDDRLVARLDRAASLQTALEQARSRVQELEAERERNLEGLDQVAREYRRRGALVRTLRADVASSDEHGAVLASELTAMRDESSRLEEERMSLLRRAEAGEQLSEQTNAQLDEARLAVEQAKAAAAELQALLDGSEEQVRTLETTVAAGEADRRSMQSSLAGRDERVRRLELALSERDERLRSVESELAELGGRLVELGEPSPGV